MKNAPHDPHDDEPDPHDEVADEVLTDDDGELDGIDPAGAEAGDAVVATVVVDSVDELKKVLAAELSTDTTQHYLNQIGTRALLTAALDLTRPGGVVLYATCSPVVAETSRVVGPVADGRDDVVLEDVGALLPQLTDAAGPLPGTIQLWPHRHGTDAMFMALLRRIG